MTSAQLHGEALNLCARLRSALGYTAGMHKRARIIHALNRAWARADRRGLRYMLKCEACGRPTPMKANGVGMCCWGKE